MTKRIFIIYILSILFIQPSIGQTSLKSNLDSLENHTVIDILKVTSDLYFIRSTGSNNLPFYKDPILSAWDSEGEFLWSRDFILNTNIVSNLDGTFTTFSNEKSEKTSCSNLVSKYDQNIKMIKFDSMGIIKFDTLYKFDCIQSAGIIVKTDNGILMYPNYYPSFTFGLSKYPYKNSLSFDVPLRYSIWKITDNGIIEWTQIIQNWWSKGHSNIEVNKENLNMYLPLKQGSKGLEIIQFSGDGKIQKREEYNMEGFTFQKIKQILPIKDKNLLAMGIEEHGCCQYSGVLTYIEDGVTKWTEKFEGRPMEMIKTMDNNFVVLSQIYDREAKEVYSSILKFDSDGHLVQEYIYKEKEAFIYSESIIEDKENEFLIIGSKANRSIPVEKKSITFKRIILD